VFCTESGTWLCRTAFVQRIWRPACDGRPDRRTRAILPGLRFHDLRHTHRTWLDEDTLSESFKSQRLGHQIPGIRGVYAHITEPMHPPLLAVPQRRRLDAGGHG
jgi:integrase